MTGSSTPWTRESIRILLLHNDKAVLRSVLAIYARQTQSEKAVAGTLEANGRGFGAGDGTYFSKIAKRIQAQEPLPSWELYKIRHRMLKYAGQLLQVALENQIEALTNE